MTEIISHGIALRRRAGGCLRRTELIGGEQGVHGSGAEAFEVEGYELESQGFENPGELGSHFQPEGAGQLVAGDFDADDFTVMADAKLAEAEPAEGVFALFDCGEGLCGDGTAVFDAGREAGGGGPVPEAPAAFPGAAADAFLAERRV